MEKIKIEREKTIQETTYEILTKFGNTEMGRYKIQLMCDQYAEEYLEKHHNITIDKQVIVIKDILEEMMTSFDTEEDRMDFILDICNGYKKRISIKSEEEECCPNCGECENIRSNYDYYQKHRPIENFLCNECGIYFKPKEE